jgi:hypothetical protein
VTARLAAVTSRLLIWVGASRRRVRRLEEKLVRYSV